MKIIVAYDVSTETTEGRRRLRRVAKMCERMGQRVQKSLFECDVNKMQLEEIERNLVSIIDESKDCLRLYKIGENARLNIKEYGKFKAVDFDDAMVV